MNDTYAVAILLVRSNEGRNECYYKMKCDGVRSNGILLLLTFDLD